MKIIADQNIPFVKEAFAEFGDVTTCPAREITKNSIKDATMLLVRSVTIVNNELLEGSQVRFVASATTGIDHIDIDYLKEKNIGFAHAPGSNANSVAEYITSVLLVLSKKLNKPLSSLTLGIVGVGNVGSKVFRNAYSLGVQCILNDPPKRRITGKEIYQPLNELLEASDVVTLHVPLITAGDDTTYHLVNHDFLLKIKNGAILINSSRGKIIDEKVLRASRERLGGLVLDVWENEPSINNETLRITDIATPHIAGYSYDGKIKGTQMIYDQACAFFFKTPSWKIPSDISSFQNDPIDCTKSANPVFDAVMKAYPVMNDDLELRKILDEKKDKHGLYFENLRKNYWKRLEFSHYPVKLTPEQAVASAALKTLGFNI